MTTKMSMTMNGKPENDKDMNELKIEHNKKVVAAWHSICDWCKCNLALAIPGGFVVRLQFETFGWRSFAITEKGEVQLHTGSHGDTSQRVYTRDFAYEFASRFCYGPVHHSHFGDHDKKPYECNEFLSARADKAYQIETDCRFVNLSAIEKVIYQWQYLKDQIQYQVNREKSLDDFKA